MFVIDVGAHRNMTMRNCHTREECLEFYAREGIDVIEYLGETAGYHNFREYYAPEVINVNPAP